MTRRDEWLALAARMRPRDGRVASGVRRRAVVALLVGWLVLMTVWGVGRSAAPERHLVFLAIGLAAAAVTVWMLGRSGGRD